MPANPRLAMPREYEMRVTATESTTVDPRLPARILTLRQVVAALEALSKIRLNASFS